MSKEDATAASPPDVEEYDESEDDDFDPNATVDMGDVSSGAETDADTAAVKKPARGKRKRPSEDDGEEAEDVGFENSGDEAIVKRGTKKRRKQGDGEAEDSGGEGGFVKTRRMRAEAAEEQSRRPLATTVGATIDVDAIWAEMNDPEAPAPPAQAHVQHEDVPGHSLKDQIEQEPKITSADLIEIEETYKFAGEVHTTKKLVPRSSEEGQTWLKTHIQPAAEDAMEEKEQDTTSAAKRHPDTGDPLLRPLRRISLWDPNPAGVVKGLPANALTESDAGNRLRVVDKSKLGWHSEETKGKTSKATKLNVVEKSKLDWNAHVDAAGDKEELEKAAKAKGNYLERKDFLDRVENRKDDAERMVRGK